jgi:hypothetical protein
MVKMAGCCFGRKKNYGLTVTVSSEPWCSAALQPTIRFFSFFLADLSCVSFVLVSDLFDKWQ